LAIIHFRLQCRDSEGTVDEVTSDNIQNLSDRQITWAMRGLNGDSITDSRGYGEIHQVFLKSPKYDRLRLGANGEYLYMRANEITSVVAPKPWCNP
jgi:hypothetical protein